MQRALSNLSSQRPEYSIYVYHRKGDIAEGHTDWEKMLVTRHKYRAMRWAEKYHDCADFAKVEVKCKAYDERYARPVDRTIRVLHEEKPRYVSFKRFLKMPKVLKRLAVR
ncbi:MAG: hypothetical protein ACRBCT_00750 [Alphaproteobacteria bacterium]